MQIKSNYPLKNITTLQIGGPAKKFVTIHTEDELIEVIQHAKQNNLPAGRQGLDYLLIGGGSNLLVSDEGIDKLIIQNKITGIASQGQALQVQSGTILQDLVDYSISHGLSGLQKLTGIPGTLGGAVYGNAGAYGQTISDNIISVVILSERSESKDLSKDECEFNYRDSIFKRNKLPILEVTFELEKATPKLLQQAADEVLQKRLVKYPPGIKCPGSFFKNIVASTLSPQILKQIPAEAIVYGKLPAGYLLEQVGAKGQKLDGIEITDYHANLFVNRGNGTAQAFYNLAKTYAQKVKQKFGITLEPEVQFINLPPFYKMTSLGRNRVS